ncbi:hypothetical protein C8J57DRAFT_1588146 [Mycena rebaudengoi]|nr:hypothetical protein C8J57DRAFT_1588146 [Mycena rebaudengoi]
MDVGSSPRKRPPFSPRKAARPPSPEANDVGFESVNPVLGNSLIIRSVYISSKPITAHSAALLARSIINSILDAHPELPSVAVRQFSSSKASSSCYLSLVDDETETDDNPRFDLLELWLALLKTEKPEWEVSWQPAAGSKDKRMSVRFTEAGFKKAKGDTSPCTALEKVKASLVARGMIITDSFSTAYGSFVSLANHTHVDELLKSGYTTIPSISPNPIPVVRSRQIEIEHAFEVVITGISEGEGAQSSVCCWIANEMRDPVSNETCFVDARVPDYEGDCLVVWMCDWIATARLLALGDSFDLKFKNKIPNVHHPQILLAFNNDGVYRTRPIAETFQAGAASMTEGLNAIRAELAEFKRETRAQHESSQLAISALATSVGTISANVEHLSVRMTNHAAALIAITAEQGVRAQLTQVELHMNQQLSMINFGQPRHKVAAEAEYDRLMMKQKTLMDSLSASAGKPLALLGGSVGNAISPPVVPPGIPPPAPRREKSPSTDELNKNKRAKTGDGVTDNDSDMRDVSSLRRIDLLHVLVPLEAFTVF